MWQFLKARDPNIWVTYWRISPLIPLADELNRQQKQPLQMYSLGNAKDYDIKKSRNSTRIADINQV
jgi:hypothetical protein